MDLPFVTAKQLAASLEMKPETLLDHFVRKYPERENIPVCPHRHLGNEYYFVVEQARRWLENPFEFE